MPINVVCPGCKKRFKVSDKYAGQKGPCPKCKTEITIPSLDEQVVVHAPEDAGPKDSKGRSLVQPILREETEFSLTMAIGIGTAILASIVVAAILRSYDGDVPYLIRALGLILLAPPLVLGGYSFLRDSELEPYQGQELWIRVAACSAAYAAIWGVYAWIRYVLELDQMEIWQLAVVAVASIAAGGFAAFASFELDFLVGTMHYGLYLIVTIMLAYIAKVNPF
jgi:hypothetical protein